MPLTGRHIARRERARGSALALPALLLAASAGAFAGLAALPPALDAVAAAPAATGTVPVPVDATAADRLAKSSAEGRDVALAGRASLRASRDRRPATAPTPVATPAVRPSFARPGVGPLTSRFGHRWGRLHAGIDLAAGTGAPVSAAADGTVLSAQSEGGYGLVVRVQHAEDTVTVYAHLSAVLVEAGAPVQAGAVLGHEGDTGHSTGPHLHFEVRVGGTAVDPLPWLAARGVHP